MTDPDKEISQLVNGLYSEQFLIDEILPAREVHLLAGPSGSGKTRWLFDTLLEWHKGQPILGYRSYPVPWVYVASDRSMESVNRTFEKLGIHRNTIHTIPAWDKEMTVSQIFGAVEDSGAKFAVIESFGSFVEPPGNSKCVKNFISAVSRVTRAGITVLGVMESPKMKPNEKYENPRQRVSGAAGWSHYCDTLFILEPNNPKTPADPSRMLYVCPRNEASIEMVGGFDPDGHIRFRKPDPAKLAKFSSRLSIIE